MSRGPGGLLHPGEMGSALGAMLRGGGGRVVWAAEGRSGPSHDRAPRAGLEDVGTLPALVRDSAVIRAVCPPHAALAVAREVARHQFSGLYLDGNAIAPETARAVGRVVGATGASFVDGGIVGPPPKAPGTTRRYVSGPKATAVAGLPDGFSSAAALVYRRLERYLVRGGGVQYVGWCIPDSLRVPKRADHGPVDILAVG